MATLTARQLDLLKGKNFAVVATVGADGEAVIVRVGGAISSSSPMRQPLARTRRATIGRVAIRVRARRVTR